MLDKEEAEKILEVLQSVKHTVEQIRDNPLLVSQEDLDALEYDINLFNDLYKR